MGKRKSIRKVVATVPGVELLRIAHSGNQSGDSQLEASAESIYSLLALQLSEEIVSITQDMMPHYKRLAKAA